MVRVIAHTIIYYVYSNVFFIDITGLQMLPKFCPWGLRPPSGAVHSDRPAVSYTRSSWTARAPPAHPRCFEASVLTIPTTQQTTQAVYASVPRRWAV